MWTPNEIRKLVAQIAGIIFGVGGISLMISGVKATGKINISTNLISGEIESGSAGLLLLFFSFFLIVLPSIRNSKTVHSIENNLKTNDASKKSKEIKKLFTTTVIGTILTLTLLYSSEYLNHNKYSFAGFVFFGGIVIGVVTGIMLLSIAIVYLTDEDEETKSTEKSK